jgi:hypothetical protein
VTLFTEGLQRQALTGLLAQAGQVGGDGIKIAGQEEDGHSALQPPQLPLRNHGFTWNVNDRCRFVNRT